MAGCKNPEYKIMWSLQAASILRFRLTEFTCLPIAVLCLRKVRHTKENQISLLKQKSKKLTQFTILWWGSKKLAQTVFSLLFFLTSHETLPLRVMNGPLKFLTARKILPLLDLLAKFKRVLACSEAGKANFLFLVVLAKKSQCSACSRMLANTIRHPTIGLLVQKTTQKPN